MPQLHSPRALEPARHNYRVHALWSPRATAREKPAHCKERSHVLQLRPDAAKKKKKIHTTLKANPSIISLSYLLFTVFLNSVTLCFLCTYPLFMFQTNFFLNLADLICQITREPVLHVDFITCTPYILKIILILIMKTTLSGHFLSVVALIVDSLQCLGILDGIHFGVLFVISSDMTFCTHSSLIS